MRPRLTAAEVHDLAAIELNLFNLAHTLPGIRLEGAQLDLGGSSFRGLLVYDPWPPNVGVITRWENFDTQTYRRAFTAHVTTI
jgi:hypothetical protein